MDLFSAAFFSYHFHLMGAKITIFQTKTMVFFVLPSTYYTWSSDHTNAYIQFAIAAASATA